MKHFNARYRQNTELLKLQQMVHMANNFSLEIH